jgi:hypothetical protein
MMSNDEEEETRNKMVLFPIAIYVLCHMHARELSHFILYYFNKERERNKGVLCINKQKTKCGSFSPFLPPFSFFILL